MALKNCLINMKRPICFKFGLEFYKQFFSTCDVWPVLVISLCKVRFSVHCYFVLLFNFCCKMQQGGLWRLAFVWWYNFFRRYFVCSCYIHMSMYKVKVGVDYLCAIKNIFAKRMYAFILYFFPNKIVKWFKVTNDVM